MDLTRTATAAVLGLGSGAVEGAKAGELTLGETKINYATLLEAAGLAAGAILQLAMPFRLPKVADGLVDGGIALLARRGGDYAVKQLGVGGASAALGYRVTPALGAGAYAFPALGALSGSGRYQNT